MVVFSISQLDFFRHHMVISPLIFLLLWLLETPCGFEVGVILLIVNDGY